MSVCCSRGPSAAPDTLKQKCSKSQPLANSFKSKMLRIYPCILPRIGHSQTFKLGCNASVPVCCHALAKCQVLAISKGACKSSVEGAFTSMPEMHVTSAINVRRTTRPKLEQTRRQHGVTRFTTTSPIRWGLSSPRSHRNACSSARSTRNTRHL